MKHVLVLGRMSRSTNLLLNFLSKEKYMVSFIEERRDDKIKLIAKRIKKLGLFTVVSQVVFMLLIKVQGKSKNSIARLNQIELSLVKEVGRFQSLSVVTNVNEVSSIDLIKNAKPDYIVLSGTRILSSEFLNQISCPIINIHAGINPAYRGVHGGYWSLVNGEPQLFGATIHLVDEGIDTGLVLCHCFVNPSRTDNFSTYPLLQMSIALQSLPKVLTNLSKNNVHAFIPDLSSNIWSHPTVRQYVINRFKCGIK